MGIVEEKKSAPSTLIKVLIADDDTPTRILLRAAISQWGYEVVEAKDGEEAWKIMQSPDSPPLLILDWLMPKLDGIALCELSKQELASHPYIILLTQVTGATNITKGLEAGADEFLSKPFNMAELRSRLSVGARIINYKNLLFEQTTQLQKGMKQLKDCASVAADLAKLPALQSDNAKITSLQQQLEMLISALNQLLIKTTKPG